VHRAPVYRVDLVRERTASIPRRAIRSPEDAADALRAVIGDPDREVFCVLLLDGRNRVIGAHTAAVGTATSAPVTPPQVFRAALLAGAVSVIVGHNHPSGDPEPSAEDRQVTRMLAHAGSLLGIQVLDHVILGEGVSHTSLRALGELDHAA
jgi:DNA repair protein RadC